MMFTIPFYWCQLTTSDHLEFWLIYNLSVPLWRLRNYKSCLELVTLLLGTTTLDLLPSKIRRNSLSLHVSSLSSPTVLVLSLTLIKTRRIKDSVLTYLFISHTHWSFSFSGSSRLCLIEMSRFWTLCSGVGSCNRSRHFSIGTILLYFYSQNETLEKGVLCIGLRLYSFCSLFRVIYP